MASGRLLQDGRSKVATVGRHFGKCGARPSPATGAAVALVFSGCVAVPSGKRIAVAADDARDVTGQLLHGDGGFMPSV